MMKKKQMIGLMIAAVLFVAVGITSVLTNSYAENLVQNTLEQDVLNSVNSAAPSEPYIAIVQVSGTIQEQTVTEIWETAAGYQHNDTLAYIDMLMEDSYNKGILLYVDSPGGTVYESEELYLKLKEYKEKTGQPIWEYMAHYAASGGYMISMNSDKIYANPNTTTGSIGVIMSGYDMTGLYEKLGIRNTPKSEAQVLLETAETMESGVLMYYAEQ